MKIWLWLRSLWRKDNIRMVLIRKTVQPMGTLSEMYLGKEFVSFVYDTLPPGESIRDAREVTYSVGNNARGTMEITIPSTSWRKVREKIFRKNVDIEVLERWALRA